jgi:hypothetical protein
MFERKPKFTSFKSDLIQLHSKRIMVLFRYLKMLQVKILQLFGHVTKLDTSIITVIISYLAILNKMCSGSGQVQNGKNVRKLTYM